MKRIGINVVLLAIIVMMSGCGFRDTDFAKNSKALYYKYVNTPVELKLEDTDKLSEEELILATRFARLDKELTSLERAMDAILDPAKQENVMALLNRFPWLSNVYVLSDNADILGAIPASAPAIVDFSYARDLDMTSRDTYGHILSDGTDSLFLIVRPYLQSDVLVGFLAVSFDPKSLLPFVGDSSNVFMQSLDNVLWAGNEHAVSYLSGVDFSTKIDRRSFGTLSHDNPKVTWLVRYYSGLPLIFGTYEE